MKAIILAGGFGTRLKGVIGQELPKPMAPLEGEPFLAHYLRYLRGQGVKEVVISLHHLGDVIKAFFGGNFEGVTIHYAEEEAPLGTGGAVRFALSKLSGEGPVLVSNGDSFVEFDAQAMMRAHAAAGARLTIALREMADCSRYGEVQFDWEGRITAFDYPGRAQAGWISTGVYVVSRDIFAGFDLPEAFSFEAEFQRVYLQQVNMLAWPMDGYFIDIGVPEDYARAQRELKQRMGAVEMA